MMWKKPLSQCLKIYIPFSCTGLQNGSFFCMSTVAIFPQKFQVFFVQFLQCYFWDYAAQTWDYTSYLTGCCNKNILYPHWYQGTRTVFIQCSVLKTNQRMRRSLPLGPYICILLHLMCGNKNDRYVETYDDGHHCSSMEICMTVSVTTSTSGLKSPKQILLKIWKTTTTLLKVKSIIGVRI